MNTSQSTPSRHRRITAGYLAAFIMLGISRAFLGPSLLEFSQNTSVQLGEISSLFVVLGLGNLTGNWLGGWFFDRLPGNSVLITVIVANALLLALAPVLSNLVVLAVLILILGFGYGVLETGGNTLMMGLHPQKVGSYISGLYVFTGIGSLLTPVVIGLGVELTHDIGIAYWTLGLLALPPLILLWRLPGPCPQTQQGTGTNPSIDFQLVGFICLFFFLCVGSQASFSGWIYTYAVQLNLADKLLAAYLTSVYWIAQTLGTLLGIILLDRFKPQTLLYIIMSGGLLSLITVLYLPGAAAIWLGTISLGITMAPLFPTAFAFVSHRMPVSGKVNGWFLAGASFGAMGLPWVVGQTVAYSGPRNGMFAIVAVFILAFLFLIGFMRYKLRCETRVL